MKNIAYKLTGKQSCNDRTTKYRVEYGIPTHELNR